MLISKEEYQRLSELLPLVQIEITKPKGRIEIILSYEGFGCKFISPEKLDRACRVIRAFVEEGGKDGF